MAIPVERGPLGWEEGGSRSSCGARPWKYVAAFGLLRGWLHVCTDGDRHRLFWTLWLQPARPSSGGSAADERMVG